MTRSIYIVGDSTAADNTINTYPQAGWGQLLQLYMTKDIKVYNHAKNGRSSKSFLEEGLFDTVLEQIEEGDVLLISFGHNDQKDDPTRHTDSGSTYRELLKVFIDGARSKLAIPVLVSSLFRRHFDSETLKSEVEVHGLYPASMRILSKEVSVPLIDLCELSRSMIEALGDIPSKDYFLHFQEGVYKNFQDGLEDNTHLSYKGALAFAQVIHRELIRKNIWAN